MTASPVQFSLLGETHQFCCPSPGLACRLLSERRPRRPSLSILLSFLSAVFVANTAASLLNCQCS